LHCEIVDGNRRFDAQIEFEKVEFSPSRRPKAQVGESTDFRKKFDAPTHLE